MPFVRQHGRQVELVHGVRNAEGKVEQRLLFALHSKPEALEAIGKGKQKNAHLFRGLVEAQYPELDFRWPRLVAAIKKKLDVLPDAYEYAGERVRANFRKSLCSFVAQLAHADPHSLLSAAELIKDHRHELEWLHDLIKSRLNFSSTKPNDWNQDNEYCWRFVLRGSEVPMDALEQAESLLDKGQLDRAASLYRLFLEAFGQDADVHNRLGLIAQEKNNIEEALAEFRKTIEIGRRSCPRRISKKSFRDDFRSRPYLRGLTNMASALNLAGKFEEALAVLDQLDRECGDLITANSWRAVIYLNTKRWDDAARAASAFKIIPSESIPASLALYELGRHDECAVHAFHAAMNSPRATRMLHDMPVKKPATSFEADDWNEGVHLCQHLHKYLISRSPRSRNYFRSFLRDPRVLALQLQAEDAEAVWRNSENREGFVTMNHLRSLDFARKEGLKLVGTPRHPGKKRRSS